MSFTPTRSRVQPPPEPHIVFKKKKKIFYKKKAGGGCQLHRPGVLFFPLVLLVVLPSEQESINAASWIPRVVEWDNLLAATAVWKHSGFCFYKSFTSLGFPCLGLFREGARRAAEELRSSSEMREPYWYYWYAVCSR